MARIRKNKKIIMMVELAILTAAVLILQLASETIKLTFLGTPISFVLVPIAFGAMVLGPLAGAWLGFVFGMVIFITCGVMALDPFTALLFADNPTITFLICVLKSTLAGFLSGVVYKLLAKKTALGAAFAAAATAPLVNTGIFILGCFVMMNTVSSVAAGLGQSFLYFVIIGCAGFNFLFEMLLNLLLAPALCRVVNIVTHKL